MKYKMAGSKGFYVYFILSYLIFSFYVGHAAEPLIEETKQDTGLKLDVAFDFNSANLSEGSRKYLDKLGAKLNSPQWTSERFIIEGHTDTLGDEQYNLNLSSKRAEVVRSYLLQKSNINPDRIIAKGYGESRPLDTSKTVKANIINRRVIMRHIITPSVVKQGSLLEIKDYIVIIALIIISGILGMRLSYLIFQRV